MTLISLQRRRPFADKIAQSLRLAGEHDAVLRITFTQTCRKMLAQLPRGASIPETFFDLNRAGRIYARRMGWKRKSGLEAIFSHPSLLLEVNGLPAPKIKIRKRFYHSSMPPLAPDDIEACARATLAATGKSYDPKGPVAYGPLAGKTSWNNIKMAFHYGQRGLDQSGFTSLSDFLASRGLPILRRKTVKEQTVTPQTAALRAA